MEFVIHDRVLSAHGLILRAAMPAMVGSAAGNPGSTAAPDGAQSFGCFNLGHTPYVQAMGTSASARLTAGAVALVRGARPGWNPNQAIAALRTAATSIPSLPSAPLLNPAALLMP